MVVAINEQINKEIYSAYLYGSMVSYAASIGLKGVANWFSIQIQEESFHAQKFFTYVLDKGERVILDTISKPDADFKSAVDLFERTLAHELTVTASINNLVDIANAEKDHASAVMLQWFVTEQVEEENNVNDVLQQLKLIGKDGSGLYMLDRQLATRIYTPPATTAGPAA